MNGTFEYAHPGLLWLLTLLPVLAVWKARRGKPAAIRLPSTADALAAGALPRSRIGGLFVVVSLLSFALLILALARPRVGRGSTEIEASGIDMMITIDVSGSMEAMDFELDGKPMNRLEVVKAVVAKFVTQRPNDKLGMTAAGRPYLVSPLTLDHEFLGKRLREVKMGRVEDGTAIGSAIASSVGHLKDSDAKSKIVVLLTDGVNTAGAVNPLTAAEAAKAMGIKVYTIGAGIQGEAPMPLRDRFGGTHYQKVKVEIDEETLRNVAESTGGRFFRATGTDSLKGIYESINQLEKTTRKLKKYQEYRELYLWFLGPALVLMVVEALLKHTRFRRLP